MEPVETERDPIEMALSIDVVLDNVVSHLKVTDLLSCRKVSKVWNSAASSVLRKRSTMMKLRPSDGNMLELMNLSPDFPFTGLHLFDSGRLNAGDAKEFFQYYGERFTRLRLETRWEGGLRELTPFVSYLPGLSILEVDEHVSFQHAPPSWRLFGAVARQAPLAQQALLARQAQQARQEASIILKLPSVRIIRILSLDAASEYILKEIVKAASPSVQIECPDARPQILRALGSGGKLQVVSLMKFTQGHSRSQYEMDTLLSIESPSLSKLEFNVDGCLSMEGLEKILVSSQNTLEELHLNGPWLSKYSWNNLPVLAKLTKLSLHLNHCRRSLFRGRHGSKFPTLKELHLHFDKYYYGKLERGDSRDFFAVPSVTRIDLEGYVDEDGMEHLAQSFPNVIDMRLNYSPYDNVFESSKRPPWQIWCVGNFKCLEKLRIWNVTVRRPNINCVTMDSFLTGIPYEISKDLHKQMQLGFTDSLPREVYPVLSKYSAAGKSERIGCLCAASTQVGT